MSGAAYWNRIVGHPWLPVAVTMSGAALLVGGWLATLLIVGCWVLVLIAARYQSAAKVDK